MFFFLFPDLYVFCFALIMYLTRSSQTATCSATPLALCLHRCANQFVDDVFFGVGAMVSVTGWRMLRVRGAMGGLGEGRGEEEEEGVKLQGSAPFTRFPRSGGAWCGRVVVTPDSGSRGCGFESCLLLNHRMVDSVSSPSR